MLNKNNEKAQVVEIHKNYKCPYKHNCTSLDYGSLPLCPVDYTSCRDFIKKNNPKLYKEFFGEC